MTEGSEALLVGPRGRRLCLELAQVMARDAGSPPSEDLLRAVMFAAHGLDPGSSAVMVIGGDAIPTATPAEVAERLDALALAPVDERGMLEALRAAVDSARYWQEPDGDDVLAGTAEVRASLARFAVVAATTEAAAWWSTPLARDEQWAVTFDDPATARLSATNAVDLLALWRAHAGQEEARAMREWPTDPRANFSATWWSTPPAELTRTTRARGALGPMGLWLVEDAYDWDRATAGPVSVPPAARIYEVDGPHAWVSLCRRYPLEVTASRRHDWYRATGVEGRWLMPDWARVAGDVDAVHLTVRGYLTAAGRALPVTDDASTVLAGWHPDATWWLVDVPTSPGDARRWSRDDEGAWTEVPR
ncbi:hypothetical protein [Cellulomonas edaphi]|uniref:Uncharacterized protein n=1 Tax=Cellulomonas edaphi TaxID=3053468 RepID=A0ABT7SAF5_9CELL|nr:hypothetical protein [Cellulomons edaphi]MDM7832607.1 hypothetical protein [Cellulomons edaphi]